MKIREGFVSNSSSASFILFKKYLTEEQIKNIVSLNEKDIKAPNDSYSECWHITEEDEFIKGETSMDNDLLYEMITNMDPPIPMKAVINWRGDA